MVLQDTTREPPVEAHTPISATSTPILAPPAAYPPSQPPRPPPPPSKSSSPSSAPSPPHGGAGACTFPFAGPVTPRPSPLLPPSTPPTAPAPTDDQVEATQSASPITPVVSQATVSPFPSQPETVRASPAQLPMVATQVSEVPLVQERQAPPLPTAPAQPRPTAEPERQAGKPNNGRSADPGYGAISASFQGAFTYARAASQASTTVAASIGTESPKYDADALLQGLAAGTDRSASPMLTAAVAVSAESAKTGTGVATGAALTDTPSQTPASLPTGESVFDGAAAAATAKSLTVPSNTTSMPAPAPQTQGEAPSPKPVDEVDDRDGRQISLVLCDAPGGIFPNAQVCGA